MNRDAFCSFHPILVVLPFLLRIKDSVFWYNLPLLLRTENGEEITTSYLRIAHRNEMEKKTDPLYVSCKFFQTPIKSKSSYVCWYLWNSNLWANLNLSILKEGWFKTDKNATTWEIKANWLQPHDYLNMHTDYGHRDKHLRPWERKNWTDGWMDGWLPSPLSPCFANMLSYASMNIK